MFFVYTQIVNLYLYLYLPKIDFEDRKNDLFVVDHRPLLVLTKLNLFNTALLQI